MMTPLQLPTGKVLERCITLSTRIGRLQRRCHRLSVATRASLALDWSSQAPRHRWVSLVVLTGHQQEKHQFQFNYLPFAQVLLLFSPVGFKGNLSRIVVPEDLIKWRPQMKGACGLFFLYKGNTFMRRLKGWSHLVSEPCFPQSSRLACQGDKPLHPRTLFEPNSSPKATKCYRPNPNRLRGNLRIALAVLPCIFHGTPFTPTSKGFFFAESRRRFPLN